MRSTLTAAALAVALAFSSGVSAQAGKTYEARPMEGIVTITHVDKNARTVTIVGPKGNQRVVSVPPEAQNFDKLYAGERFKVRFYEEVAVSISKDGQASGGTSVQVTPKGGRPGGTATRTVALNAIVEAVDAKDHEITLKGPQGSHTLKVAQDVKLDGINPGDNVSVVHTQALAIDMAASPQPMVEPHWTP
jgi:hypothetical protein